MKLTDRRSPLMPLADCVLIVEDSQCMLEFLAQLLRPHVKEAFTAATYRAACEQLKQHPHIDLVICDVLLPDGNGFFLLDELANASGPMPNLLFISARWEKDDWQRAMSLGARDYLPKPISIRDIRNALLAPARPRVRDSRYRTLASVRLIDPKDRERLLCLEIHNISKTGALLSTAGPIPVGTELEFEIVRDEKESIRGKATVVRVQEPTWLNPGGVAVRFDWIDSPTTLARMIRADLEAPAPETE